MSAPPSSSVLARMSSSVGSDEPERRPHEPHRPDGAVLDERLHGRGLRVVAVHERLHQHEPRGLGACEGLLDLGGTARVRLLAEDVLAGVECRERPLVVEPVRQRDVDAVDLVVGEQRLVGAMAPGDPVLARIRLGPRAVPASDRDDLDPVGVLCAAEDRVVDPRRREQAEPHRGRLRGGGRRMCAGGAGGSSVPAPVSSMARSISRRAPSSSAMSEAGAQPSTWRAVRAPTIAPVTPGCASTHATASAAGRGPRSGRDRAQAIDEREAPRDLRLLERRRTAGASRRPRAPRAAPGRTRP